MSTCDKRTRANVAQYSITWEAFVERVKKPVVDNITLAEYLNLPKDIQVERKDVGGYIGGTFRGNKRKRENLKGRDILTFDLDNLNSRQDLDKVISTLRDMDIKCCVHSTRKHTNDNPRIRVLILLDRTVTGEEYEAIARIIADDIGMEFFDITTFQPARLMFLPSVCSDSNYLFEEIGSKPLDTAKTLLTVSNWKDYGNLPPHPSEVKKSQIRANKQQDPTTKGGLIGAFCRAYSIHDVIDELIPEAYLIAMGDPNRYTYRKGTTTGGAVVYDGGKFMYSNHATDPAGGALLNAFDLVRVHKFGNMDAKCRADTKTENKPSYKAMVEFVAKDSKTRNTINKETFAESEGLYEPDGSDKAWLSELKLKKDGSCAGVINNVVLILENDSNFKDKIVYNDFSYRLEVTKSLPWHHGDFTTPQGWTDSDDANLFNYLELYYGIANQVACEKALTIVAHRHTINPVADYLKNLVWDGVPRIETVFTDYLGASDTTYTRAVARVCMTASVARALDGGNKYDYMPILTGVQGIGKSTFLAIIGGDWFTDSLATFDSKTGAELIQGKWIAEVGELAAMNRHESAVIKQFLTRTHDRYRVAYGRRAEDYKRRCVFFGTSNEDEFLKDLTGNRRFLPIECVALQPKKNIWRDLSKERDQLWAEAVELYRSGMPLHLTKAEEELAEAVREGFIETPVAAGMIEEFIKEPVPEGWDEMDIQARKLYLAMPEKEDGNNLRKRECISAIEIWVECLGGDIKKYTKKDAKEINFVLKKLSCGKSQKRTKAYGKQRTWRIVPAIN